jgi:hypothetical protein
MMTGGVKNVTTISPFFHSPIMFIHPYDDLGQIDEKMKDALRGSIRWRNQKN